MKKVVASLIALGFLASPVLADQEAITKAGVKAEDQYQKGKPEEAIKTLQKTADQNPTSAEAYRLLAAMQARTGNVDDASRMFVKAVELGGSGTAKAQSLVALADFQLRAGSSREALKNAQEAAKVEGTPSPTTLAALARAQARAGDPAAAETAKHALQAAPKNAAVQEAYGQVLLSLSNSDAAAAAFREALTLDPKLTRARVGLAGALLQRGNAAEAVTEARKASEEGPDPKSGEAHAVLGLALLAQNPSNWAEAIAAAQQGAFLEAKNPSVQIAVGKIFEGNNNIDQAEASYKRAVEVDPASVPAQTALVSVLVRRGKTDEAAAAIEKLAEAAPNSPDVQLQRGRILLRKASKGNAVADYMAAADALEKAAAGSTNPEAHAFLGTAYQYTRRPDQALAEYEQAIKLAPNNLDYRTTYGLLLGVNGKHDAGASELKKVTANPAYKDAAAWVNLGWVYRNATPPKTEESVAAYKKALDIDPKNAQAALGMGWAYSFSRLWDQAIGAFKRAMEIEPATAGEAYDGMAWSVFFKRDMAQARALYEKAKAAGRNDTRLEENILKVEKLIKAGEAAKLQEEIEKTQGPKEEKPQGPDLTGLVNQLRSKSTDVRVKAAQALVAGGRDAVPYLSYALQDSEIAVREAAVGSLAKLGPTAREALPALQSLVNSRGVPNPNASKEEMQFELRLEDLRKAARSAIERIQGR